MRRMLILFLGLCAAGSGWAGQGAAASTKTKQMVRPCETQMEAAARMHGVPLGILYAVGLTETGRRNSLHPFALNLHGKPFFARSQHEALAKVRAAQKRGMKLIDVGCMQINIHYHRSQFQSLEHMLQPAANVAYAARFLKELKAREGTWTMAVARYHAGPNNNPAQKRYVCRVIANMVASGFGKWTANSRKFCQ
ncbi:transglycosylase SLT domain-containing protein [Polycladidibacter hongkongensis]|uniref:transglycosylase SLT domain-containing protein n=1 Tax=Polycladidibacter hongkongensis TaxID=1647556 RepID=UPI00082B940D|nr:transglycosylase SLT domain-containing protein [Pseudovibrio hongkongensis]